MKKFLLFTVLFSVAAFACAKENMQQSDIIFKAMKDEITRSMDGLKAKGMPRPYYIAYQIALQDYFAVKSFMGEETLTTSSKGDVIINVMMRIGSPKRDNSFFENTLISTAEEQLPSVSYDGIRKALWLQTDDVYKQALDQYTKKEAYFKKKEIKQENPDFSPAQTVSDKQNFKFKPYDKDFLVNLVKEIKKFYTNITVLQQPEFYLSSEGAEYIKDNSAIVIFLQSEADTPKGFPLAASKSLVYKDIKELPSQEELINIAKDFSLEMQAAVKSPKGEAFIGPVLLQDDAANYLFQKVFAKNIVRTKKVYSLSSEKDLSMGEFATKKGLKIMPLDFDVTDEPQRKTYKGKKLLGYYNVDEEGTAPEEIKLVSNGKLTDLPATRSSGKTNGHARSAVYTDSLYPHAFVSNLFFSPKHTFSREELKNKLMKACRKENLDYCYIIRRFDANNMTAYKVDAKTGEETLMHGFETPALSTRTLRDITASGNDFKAYNFYSGSTPSYSIVSPSVILQELELKPSQAENKKPPKLEKPDL